jgi:hypothetical protein
LGVERAEVGEDGFVAGGGREGVGFGDGGVEVVVELAEDGDEAVFVSELFFGVERGAGAEFFEDVVEVGEGQLRVLGLLAFAVGVEALGEVALRSRRRSGAE